jgi:hypothetical protein
MRNNDWQVLFSEYIKSRRHTPFEWGQNDCCFFAADWVSKLYGVSVAAEHRGTYTTALGAARLIEQLGGLDAIAGQYLDPIEVSFASVGDIVMIENAGRDLLAICNGATSFGPGADGVAVLATSLAKKAWRV